MKTPLPLITVCVCWGGLLCHFYITLRGSCVALVSLSVALEVKIERSIVMVGDEGSPLLLWVTASGAALS